MYREPVYKKGVSDAESPDALVVGTTQLFEAGRMRHIPMPSADPKDPLNLPEWRKWAAIASLCFFGALALASEQIIGALIPVFVLEYAGIDPKILSQLDLASIINENMFNPLDTLSKLGGPPVSKVALLSTLPLVINGVASYMLVPLSIAVGRRPVLLFAATMAWVGGLWAGLSTSLDGHIAARAFQGFGAGAVAGLIPLIIQDFVFIHQRNRAVATVNASQGLIIVSLGVASPIIIERLSWRHLYFITTAGAFTAWLGLIAFVPETRWIRSKDELAGKALCPLYPGETRPRLDYSRHTRRTKWTDFGIFNAGWQWKLAVTSVWETMRTTLFPNVAWAIMLTGVLEGTSNVTTQAGSIVLLASGWKFHNLGFAVIPLVVASPFVWIFGGYLADRISNWVARRNGGIREPEGNLISLVVPLLAGIAGPLVFGYAANNFHNLSSVVVLTGIFFLGFGSITTNTVVSVYLIESYPAFAGPVLINVASLRLVLGFLLAFKATDMIQHLGFMAAFGIYSAILAAVGLFLPVMYIYGKRIRAFSAGRLEPRQNPAPSRDSADEKTETETSDELGDETWTEEASYRVHIGQAL